MISVVIPIFNTARFLRKCLDSVINQTYSDLEIILINDGSTDESEQICLEYAAKDCRILYVRKKNEGQGVARNLALHMANGAFFTAIDSDDWWELTFCEKMLYTAQKFDADITLCDFINVEMQSGKLTSQSPSRIRIRPNCVHCATTEPSLLNTCRTVFCCKLYKTDFLRTCDVLQPGYAYEDMAVTPLLSVLAARIARVPELLYFYLRNRTDSTTNLCSTKPRLLDALTLLVSRFKERNLFETYRQELLKKNHSDVRFVLSRMDKQTASTERRIVEEQLCRFLAKTYPEWIFLDHYSVTVIGSQRLQTAIKRLLFDPDRAFFFSDIASGLHHSCAMAAGYLITDCKISANQMTFFSADTCLILVEDNLPSQLDFSKNRVIHIISPTEAEDEDCACWDLSDAIFYKITEKSSKQ